MPARTTSGPRKHRAAGSAPPALPRTPERETSPRANLPHCHRNARRARNFADGQHHRVRPRRQGRRLYVYLQQARSGQRSRAGILHRRIQVANGHAHRGQRRRVHCVGHPPIDAAGRSLALTRAVEREDRPGGRARARPVQRHVLIHRRGLSRAHGVQRE